MSGNRQDNVQTAVRMLWKQGKRKGFKKDGRIYVYLNKRMNKLNKKANRASVSMTERLDESVLNVGMLKSGIMQLLRFLEGKA